VRESASLTTTSSDPSNSPSPHSAPSAALVCFHDQHIPQLADPPCIDLGASPAASLSPAAAQPTCSAAKAHATRHRQLPCDLKHSRSRMLDCRP
jgi:hypothetical protein